MAKRKAKEPLHVRDFENMADDAILAQVLLDMKASEQFQAPYFDKFKRFYKLYKSYIDEAEKQENRSNLFIPYTFHVIETVTPKIVLSVFNTRPYIQTMPLGLPNEIRDRRAKKMNKLLDYQFQQKIKLVPIVTDAIKASNIYGTAITKQTWNFKRKNVVKRRPRIDPATGIEIPGVYDEVLVESVVADDPQVTLIPIMDFFFDPASTTIDDGRYDIHRYWEDYHELEAKAKEANGLYKNLDKLKLEKDNQFSKNNASNMLSAIGLGSAENSNKNIEIWEYWTDDWVIKVANQKYVIYSNMNPFFHRKKCFSKWVDTPVPNEFYGLGEIESMESLQAELNTTRNQRIDNVSFVLNKMWKIKRGANIDTTQLISRPAGFVEVDEEDDISEIQFSDVTASSYNEEGVIKSDIDRTTGVNDTARGTQSQRRETATTMNILANAGGERFRLKTMLIEYGGLHDMANQIIALNQQYIDRPREIMVLGDDGVLDNDVIEPEEIDGAWSIVAVGSSMEPVVNKELRQTQLVQLYNMIQARPDINHQEILRTIFESFDIKNIDRIFAVTQAMMPQPGMPGAGAMPVMPLGSTGGIDGQ